MLPHRVSRTATRPGPGCRPRTIRQRGIPEHALRIRGRGADQAVRWAIKVRARCQESVTVIVEVYRRSVWLSVVPSFNNEAILDPAHVDNLVATLIQAAREARDYQP